MCVICYGYIYGQSNHDGSCGDFDIEVGDLLKWFKLIYQKRHLYVGYLKDKTTAIHPMARLPKTWSRHCNAPKVLPVFE